MTGRTHVAVGLVAWLLIQGAASGSEFGSLCASPGVANGAPPIYLAVGIDGLVRLKLSPLGEGSVATAVARDELEMLCADGFDVRAIDSGTLPTAFSIVRRNGHVYGNVWNSGKTPADTKTQWLRFDFEATGFFEQDEHVPVALFLDADALVAAQPSIIGNGIVIGAANLTPNGCGSAWLPDVPSANTEVEAFWRGGSALWSESCGSVNLDDGEEYRFFVAADAQGAVRYRNLGQDGDIVAPAIVDTSSRRPPLDAANGGVLVTATNFCNRCGDFELRFTNVASGWSALPIDASRIADNPPVMADIEKVNFDARPLGTVSSTRRITFKAIDAQDHKLSFAISGDRAPHCGDADSAALCAQEIDQEHRSFVIDASPCATLRRDQTCTVGVTFVPQGAFDETAKLEYRVDDGAWVVQIGLEGFGLPPMGDGTATPAVEYLNPTLGHYFVTTLTSEIALLDSGVSPGWMRTGEWFLAYMPGRGPTGTKPVCRYYGKPEAGIDSHFYSASASECNAIAQRFSEGWILETPDLFEIGLPDPTSGACPDGKPVYRLWNARESSNHRYTTDVETRARMIAAGWIPEGYGPLGVVMCDATP